MEIPNHFRDELERRLEEESKTEEDSRLEAKLRICRKIFDWKDRFLIDWKDESLKTEKVNLLYAEFRKYNLVNIYISGWEHDSKIESSACWSRVSITGARVHILKYIGGYRSYPPLYTERFREPREMAVYLKQDYLTQLLDTLESGRVYDDILKFNKHLEAQPVTSR